jgi:hypothetical protein
MEKLDISASGLSQASTILHEAFIAEPNIKRQKWPKLVEECRVCSIQQKLTLNDQKVSSFNEE